MSPADSTSPTNPVSSTSAGSGTGGRYEEYREQIRVRGEHLADKVKELLHEANVRHIILKHGEHTVMEIPMTLGVASIVLAPVVAAVAAVGALLTDCTIEVVRAEEPGSSPPDSTRPL